MEDENMEFNLEVRAQNGKVYTNASDLLPAIQEGLKAYDYVVDENNYKQAKTDRTTLNNLVKIVSDKRKQVENDVFAQWLQDKKDIMAVEKTIKAASDKLGNGIIEYSYAFIIPGTTSNKSRRTIIFYRSFTSRR